MSRGAKGQGSGVKKITISNLNKSYKLNENFIKKIVLKILRFLKKPRGMELEIIFLDDNSMRSLNRRFKRRDRPTDVLSFKIDLNTFEAK